MLHEISFFFLVRKVIYYYLGILFVEGMVLVFCVFCTGLCV